MKKNAPIGFFDSGVGGLSVLKKSIEILPNENYIYFGDSINAPYGSRSEEEIITLTTNAIELLIQKGVKAVVIACNTATSIVANILRDKYPDIPILGIEPAIKPAINKSKDGLILVMATPMTLSKGKFINKLEQYNSNYNIEKVPCYKLAELIENGHVDDSIVESYLDEVLNKYKDRKIDSIVLGCTHYPFVAKSILKIINKDVHILDGSLGTINNLKHTLDKANILNDSSTPGSIEILNSLNKEDIIDFSKKLLQIK